MVKSVRVCMCCVRVCVCVYACAYVCVRVKIRGWRQTIRGLGLGRHKRGVIGEMSR